jgi:hypothetical protein
MRFFGMIVTTGACGECGPWRKVNVVGAGRFCNRRLTRRTSAAGKRNFVRVARDTQGACLI